MQLQIRSWTLMTCCSLQCSVWLIHCLLFLESLVRRIVLRYIDDKGWFTEWQRNMSAYLQCSQEETPRSGFDGLTSAAQWMIGRMRQGQEIAHATRRGNSGWAEEFQSCQDEDFFWMGPLWCVFRQFPGIMAATRWVVCSACPWPETVVGTYDARHTRDDARSVAASSFPYRPT